MEDDDTMMMIRFSHNETNPTMSPTQSHTPTKSKKFWVRARL